jgi:hypothetical protein
LTASKFFIIILSLILFYNTAVAVAKPGVTVIPSNGSAWLSEIDKTIEKLIVANQESSQKIEEMTGEIQRLTERLVVLTWVLVVITLLPFIIRFFKWLLYPKKQNTIRKNKKKAYPYYRVRKRRFYLK